jgi:hypothetical protein
MVSRKYHEYNHNDNDIYNIGYQGTGIGRVSGIQVYTNAGAGGVASTNKILKNRISDLYTSGVSSSAIGISVGGATVGTIVSQNNITNLTNTQSASSASGAVGIVLSLITATSSH